MLLFDKNMLLKVKIMPHRYTPAFGVNYRRTRLNDTKNAKLRNYDNRRRTTHVGRNNMTNTFIIKQN